MSVSLANYTQYRLTPRQQLEILGDLKATPTFRAKTRSHGLTPLRARAIGTLQVNVGKKCNQQCRHCHVDAGPHRTEEMSRETFEACLRLAELADVEIVDITGGAPEMNPHFRWFVSACRALGIHVIDRCNLTILETRKHNDLPDFLAEHQVEIVASLPHFRKRNTDRQRGEGVFDASTRALRRLNALGYGKEETELVLNLVTNPVGAFLPADQKQLEADWKRQLAERLDIYFNRLFCITNMPISRYLEWLIERDQLEEYMMLLVESFNASAVPGVMCRDMLSVSWDGRLFDCDFNQMLDLELAEKLPTRVEDVGPDDIERLAARRIHTARHCFGCTAGAGSSCGGNTA